MSWKWLGVLAALLLAAPLQAATLLPNAEQCFLTPTGAANVGGKVFMYVPQTTTAKQTWRDAAQTQLNTTPIVLDSAGCAIIYGVGTYRQVVMDATATQTFYDQLTTDTSASNSVFWAGNAGGTANTLTVVDPGFSATDGLIINFNAVATNTGATTLNPSGFGAIPILKDTQNSGPVALTGNEITAGNPISVIYRTVDGSFHLLNPPVALGSMTRVLSLDLYVDPSQGSDANNCTAPGSAACHTIGAAVNLVLNKYAFSGTNPNIHLANGIYQEQITCSHGVVGATGMNITGNTAQPTLVVLQPPTLAVGMFVSDTCNVTISGVYFNSPQACAYVDVFFGTVTFSFINFGTLNNQPGCGAHILLDHSGIVNIVDTYTISGNMTYHALVVGPAFLQYATTPSSPHNTVQITNPIQFTNFFNVSGPGTIQFDNTMFFQGVGGAGCTPSPGIACSKYVVTGNGNISSNSTVIPGQGGGVLTGGGCVDSTCGVQAGQFIYLPFATQGACTLDRSAQVAGISDSPTSNWGDVITTGGGTVPVIANCNGVNWLVMGAPRSLSTTVRLSGLTVATLPACGTNAGSLAVVTDAANASTWGAAVAGGGSNNALVYCNGSTWVVTGL